MWPRTSTWPSSRWRTGRAVDASNLCRGLHVGAASYSCLDSAYTLSSIAPGCGGLLVVGAQIILDIMPISWHSSKPGKASRPSSPICECTYSGGLYRMKRGAP